MKAIKQILLIVCVSILTYVAVMTLGSAYKANMARAHSDGRMHYPAHCCHDQDCAPVDKVEVVPAARYASMMPGFSPKLPSVTLVTSKHGTVAVPEGFKRDTSTDGRMHVCIRDIPGQGKKLICIFDPPAM
jgi:hypothetical protein